MKPYSFILVTLISLFVAAPVVQGELAVRDRIRYFPVLVPADYKNFVHDRLPEVTLLSEKETERAYKQLKELRVNTTTYSWQQLAVCFMLQNRYDEALNCFIKAEEAITRFYDNSLFKAWLLEHGGDSQRAAREWSRLLEQDNTTYAYAVRLAACQLKMRQALGVSKTMDLLERRAPNDPITSHLQGVRYFMIGDFYRATESFVYSAQLAENHTLPETYLAMSMLTLHENKHEEVIGWLKLAILAATPRNKFVYYNLPPFSALYDDPAFLQIGKDLNIPLEPEGLRDETLAVTSRDGMFFYLAKYNVPENLRVNLELRLHPPRTKYRTLGFRQKRQREKEAELKRLHEEAVAEPAAADDDDQPVLIDTGNTR